MKTRMHGERGNHTHQLKHKHAIVVVVVGTSHSFAALLKQLIKTVSDTEYAGP